MTARNIVTRIVKLETARQRPDEILVVWRKPDSDVAAAAANATYAAGDKVVCAEWFGEEPHPAPKWYRRMRFEMDPTEYEYINRSVERLVEAEQRDRVFAHVPSVPDHLIAEFSDNDLLHICLGVAT
jgi:hypothetical protein